jgi:D-amino-acid dehydrogenase
MMPDMMPRVGPGKRRGVFYNTGHGHLGWTLSAATAEIVADQIERGLRSEARRRTQPGTAPRALSPAA